MGYTTYLYFCGDPDLPGEGEVEDGRLHLRRWCQWISAQHRGGVYDGEEGKIRDWNYSLPSSLIENVIEPAVKAGQYVVILGEEWHTSWSMRLISDALYYRGIRDRVVMLWNANNIYGFDRIEWAALNLASTVTTVSRYMKFRMWDWGQNPIVIPNGIPPEAIIDADPAASARLRSAAAAEHMWFKIGRFDPDKRWLMAVSAAGGIAVTGATGEDYAEAYRNSVVVETDDPVEIVTELAALKEKPRLAAHLRRRGRVTARDYLWPKVIGQLMLRIDFAAERQAVSRPAEPAPRKPRRVIRAAVPRR